MKKIVFIQPKGPESLFTFTELCKISGRPALTAPLGLATLAALTPEKYRVEIIDEALDAIDLELQADLVGITGYTVHNERMIELAESLRKRGKLVVGGGAFCSAHPDVAQEHFDVVVAGEAERVWPQFLEDWEKGDFKSLYRDDEEIDLVEHPSPIPRWDLIKNDQYLVHMVQTTRGCPYDCEFCDVVSLFGRRSRHKTTRQVIAELQYAADLGVHEVFFADDNFIGNREYAKTLLGEIIELNEGLKYPLRFLTQVTLNCADDDELMDLFKRANFEALFIGIETPNRESLIAANKRHNIRNDMLESIRKIQKRGIMIIAGMIVGFDTDDLTIFDTQRQFLNLGGLVAPLMGMLMAPKGTKLWDRLEREGRLLGREFGESMMTTNIIPKQMTKDELISNYIDLIDTIYSKDYFKKSLQAFIEQIDVNEIKTQSAAATHLTFGRTPFFYTANAFRILWDYIKGGKEDIKFLWEILRMTVRKSIYCLPVGLTALLYFRTLNGFSRRHIQWLRADQEARKNLEHAQSTCFARRGLD